jgi:hypothetical protein
MHLSLVNLDGLILLSLSCDLIICILYGLYGWNGPDKLVFSPVLSILY